MKKIILASHSIRRKELLEQIGVKFDIIISNADEDIDIDSPYEIVKELSIRKARKVFEENPDAIIIGADTVVDIKGRILGKPYTDDEAREMLKLLSGRNHSVYTGVTIISNIDGEVVETNIIENAAVFVKDLSEEEIDLYIKTGEPFDKAGGYAIQGKGAYFIEKVIGDYYTVVGLPVGRVCAELVKLGYSIEKMWDL